MSGTNARARSRSATGTARVAELEAELAAVQAQRLRDQERLGHVTRERDRLRFELAERDAAEGGAARRMGMAGDEEDGAPQIDGWLLKAGAERALLRGEPAPPATLLSRLTTSLLLRFARAAARGRHYATAEVLYQAILALAPRGFIWRQTGNMLAGQGLYAAAIDCFDRAIAFDANDSEAWHAKAVALRRADRADESMAAMHHALSLNPELARR